MKTMMTILRIKFIRRFNSCNNKSVQIFKIWNNLQNNNNKIKIRINNRNNYSSKMKIKSIKQYSR